VVLLTDGRANAGKVPVDVAAALATARGIRVHTVGIGGEGEVAIESPAAGAPRGLRFERHDLDAATLRAIAAASGGRFFRARRPEDLEAVYAEIDALERALRPAPPERLATPRPEPLLALAGGLLLVEIASARVLARRLP
jgi:Ca-activated chloride channel family protein